MTFCTCSCGLGREKRCISGERRGRDAMTCCVKGYNLVFPMSCVILESSCIQKQMKVKWNMCYNFASVHWQEMMWMYLLHWRCQHRDCRHGNRDFSTSSKSPHHFCHPIPSHHHHILLWSPFKLHSFVLYYIKWQQSCLKEFSTRGISWKSVVKVDRGKRNCAEIFE